MKILLATTNPKKVAEYQRLFRNLPWTFYTLADFNCTIEAPEDGTTFVANALQKARFYYELFHMPVISEDSGLEVFALDNFPGVHSKRWMETSSYAAKVEALLTRLGDRDRACQYHAVIAFFDGHKSQTFSGTCLGELVAPDLTNPHAFGYDCGFWITQYHNVMANLDPNVKNYISHRAQALAAFAAWLKEIK